MQDTFQAEQPWRVVVARVPWAQAGQLPNKESRYTIQFCNHFISVCRQPVQERQLPSVTVSSLGRVGSPAGSAPGLAAGAGS